MNNRQRWHLRSWCGLILSALALGGCISTDGTQSHYPKGEHPANPDVATAPVTYETETLDSETDGASFWESDFESSMDVPAGFDAGDFSCPMHHSVRSTKSVDCPLCGMKLVHKPSAHDEPEDKE